MKCKLEVICKFLESCNTEVCKHLSTETHQEEPQKRAYTKRPYRKTAKRAGEGKELSPANDADLIVARKILIYRDAHDTLSAEHGELLGKLSGRHVKNFTAEERRDLIDAAKTTVE